MFLAPNYPTDYIRDVKDLNDVIEHRFQKGAIYRFPNGTIYYRSFNDFHCFGYSLLPKDDEAATMEETFVFARNYLTEHLKLDSLRNQYAGAMTVHNRDHKIPVYYFRLDGTDLSIVKVILTELQSLDISNKPSEVKVDVKEPVEDNVVEFKQPKKENILSTLIPILTNAIDNPDGIPYILATLPILQTTKDMEFVAGAIIGVTRAVRTSLEDMIGADSHPKETQKEMIEEFLNLVQERKRPTATLTLWYDNGAFLQMNFLNTVAGYYPFAVWVDGKNLVEDAISDLCNRKNISREELFNLG